MRIHRLDSEGEALKAYATIVLDDAIEVIGLKVIDGGPGLFVAMPARRRRDGSFQDIAHPICQGAREKIDRAVLSAYHGFGDDPGYAGVSARLRPPPDDLAGWIARDPQTA